MNLVARQLLILMFEKEKNKYKYEKVEDVIDNTLRTFHKAIKDMNGEYIDKFKRIYPGYVNRREMFLMTGKIVKNLNDIYAENDIFILIKSYEKQLRKDGAIKGFNRLKKDFPLIVKDEHLITISEFLKNPV